MIRTLVIVGWLILSFILKIKASKSFLLSVVALGVSTLLYLAGIGSYADRSITYAYGFFSVGALRYIVEIYKNE